MASLVLKMSVSLDGFVAPVDGSTDWVAAGRSDDGASWTGETLSNAGAHLMGATTYAGWAAYWPGAPGPFATPMNEIPKVVFSNSLTSADWDETTIVAGDLAAAIRRLKQVQRRCRRPRLRGAPVIEPDGQPRSGRCQLAVTLAEHERPMTRMLRASRRARPHDP